MSATTKPADRFYREPPSSELQGSTMLLHEIIDRMSAIEAKQSRPSPVKLQTWEEIERFAEKAARSGMVPKDFVGKPDAICIAVQMGSELGLPPMQSLQNIAVVNGRPSIWGDAMPALCRASGVVRSIREWSEGEGDDLTFYCEAIRKDDPNPVTGKFSVQDAKRANLWKTEPKTQKRGRDGVYEVDSGPWYSYPHRMLQMRARGFALRDAFPDVLRGLISVEEAADIPFEATGLTPRLEPAQPVRHETVREPNPPTDDGELPWLAKLNEKLSAEPNGTKWLKLLDAEMAQAPTEDDARGAFKLSAVRAGREKAPETIQAMIDATLEKAVARFQSPMVIENDPNLMPAEPDFIPAGDVESV